MKSRSRLTIYAISGLIALVGTSPIPAFSFGKPLDQYNVAASATNSHQAWDVSGVQLRLAATSGTGSTAVGTSNAAGALSAPTASSGTSAPTTSSAQPSPAASAPATIAPLPTTGGTPSVGVTATAPTAGTPAYQPTTGQGGLLATSPTPQPPISTGPTITLDQVIARVLAANPTIQLAQQRVNSAQFASQETASQNGISLRATALDVATTYKTTAAGGAVSVSQPGVLGSAGIPGLTDQAGSGLYVSGTSTGGLTTGTTTTGTGSTTTTSSSTTTIVPVSPSNPGSSSSSSSTGASTQIHTAPVDTLVSKLAAAAMLSRPSDTTTGTGTTSTTDQLLTSSSPRYNNYSAGLSASKLIDVFGLVGIAEGVTAANERFYEIDRDRTANELALTVRNTYFAVLKAQDNLITAREQVANNQAIVNDATVRYNAGVAAQFDVISAQSQLANAQQSLISAQNNLDVERQTLNNLMVQPLDTEYTLAAAEQPPIPATIDAKAEVQTAYDTRPELRQVDLDLAIARKLTKIAEAGLKPTFGVGANVDYTGASPGSDNKYFNGSLVAQVSAPLDDAGLTRARVRSARNDEKTQQIYKDQLTQNIALEVRSALSNLTGAQALVTADQSGVALSRESLRIANVRYAAGAGTLLEVTNAETNLAVAEYNLASAQYQLQTAYASYLRAEGRR